MRDLSVVIPSRNEHWLARTVEDVLAHARADTEVIAVLDGAWADPPLAQRPRLTVARVPQAIGQRKATNLGVAISTAAHVMKLDGHCAVGEGFDVALLEAARELGDDIVQVPAQYNFHVFDWVCGGCGARRYQGPTPVNCACGAPGWGREVVWRRRESRLTTVWRFDAELHFQYWGGGQARFRDGDFSETMSCLGACWFLSRRRYAALGGMDERHGSWGQMGTEVGCKAWLSGGRLVTNHRTWFAHMFRTQGGDFSFPYPLSGGDQERARAYSRDLWRRNAWPGQVRPLRWLVERFWPIPGWSDADLAALPATLTGTAPEAAQNGAGRVREEAAV